MSQHTGAICNCVLRAGSHCAAVAAQLMEVLESAILCGVGEVAQAVLLRGTMGGLCRFAVSSFRRTPCRGSAAAFLVDLINIIESTPHLSAMIRCEPRA